jgi:glycosyltransferase involved in cell wall biosynthesis
MGFKLSVVIITFNEERNIARCIESVLDFADEIIVLDSLSTDKTKDICLKYPVVKFYEQKFLGHIQQKNRAMELASNDYVLSLDADEAPDEILKNNIIKIKQNGSADAYYFNRLTNYLGKWIRYSGWYPDKKLRLWNKNKGRWGGINPHDKVIMQNNSKIEYLKGNLLHYSYYSINQHIAQFNSFTDIGAKEAFKKGKKSNLFIAIYKSVWKFIRDYFFKLGFLDGYYGFIICALSSQATFAKYIKLKELYKQNANR